MSSRCCQIAQTVAIWGNRGMFGKLWYQCPQTVVANAKKRKQQAQRKARAKYSALAISPLMKAKVKVSHVDSHELLTLIRYVVSRCAQR